MSSIICLCNDSNNVWVAKNSVYSDFVDLIAERLSDNREIIEFLNLSVIFHGFTFEDIKDESFFTILLFEMKQVLQEIINGKISNPTINYFSKDCYIALFSELLDQINVWEYKLETITSEQN